MWVKSSLGWLPNLELTRGVEADTLYPEGKITYSFFIIGIHRCGRTFEDYFNMTIFFCFVIKWHHMLDRRDFNFNNTGKFWNTKQCHNRGAFYFIPSELCIWPDSWYLFTLCVNCEALQNCYCCNYCTIVHCWVPLNIIVWRVNFILSAAFNTFKIFKTYHAWCFHVWLCHLPLPEPRADVFLT